MRRRWLFGLALLGCVAALTVQDDRHPPEICGIAAWTGTCACAPTRTASLSLDDYAAKLARSGDMAAVARSERECRVRRTAVSGG